MCSSTMLWNLFSLRSSGKTKDKEKEPESDSGSEFESNSGLGSDSPLSKASCSTNFLSPDGAEEYEDTCGPEMSDSEASTSSRLTRASSFGSNANNVEKIHKTLSWGSPSKLQQNFAGHTPTRSKPKGSFDHDTVLGVPTSVWGSPVPNRVSEIGRNSASSSVSTLKEIQLRKFHNLVALDRNWDILFPDVKEPGFSWPWPTLSKQQIALGRMEFKRFILIQCCLEKLELKPEDVLSLDEISRLERVPLEDVPNYIFREVAIRKGGQARISDIPGMWLKDGLASFECTVDSSGSCKFKIVQPKQVSTTLHRAFGVDRVMPVYFDRGFEKLQDDEKYRVVRNGIFVGLRRYRLWAFKDTGKEEHANRTKATAKDYDRAIKCFFVCTESLADIDLCDPEFKVFIRAQAARCHIMHLHTVQSMAKFASRGLLALSKSLSVPLGPEVEMKMINDIICKDELGREMEHTNGTGEMSPDVAKLLPPSTFKGKPDKKKIGKYPTLAQCRIFYRGFAIKGTLQVNHKLTGLQILYRPSMVKVYPHDVLQNFATVNSFELLTTCREPREAKLSQDLIILLSIGKVPPCFFHNLLNIALENITNLFTNWDAAYQEVKESGADFGPGDQTYRMLLAGMPLSHPQIQRNLKILSKKKMKELQRGCVPLPGTYYLMGTSDPTPEKVLERNQVAIVRGDGKVWGKVLVYKNPGKHPGDVHLFDAVWDERLNPYVGLSQYTIFFSVQGDRPIVDEIANSDLDGDMYWVCENTELYLNMELFRLCSAHLLQLISLFNPSSPWVRPNDEILPLAELEPDELTPEELEIEHFDKFLRARFFKGGVPPMPMAAVCWRAHMDEYLLLSNSCSPMRRQAMETLIDDLINIFYRALDASKSGEEVELPSRFFPKSWPHHMRKEDSKKYHHSSSILGQLYDMAILDVDNLGCSWKDSMVYDPNFELGNFKNHIEKWRGHFAAYNKETSPDNEKNQKVYEKYRQMLKGDHMKPLTQVWEEASALYAVNYEHAMKALERGKHTPSLNGAMNIAGPELCQIYVMNLPEGMGEPYVMSPIVRQKILQQRYA